MAQQATGMQQRDAGSFPAMLDKFKSEIARALPKHLNADRMARIALTAFRRTPALAQCDPKSVFAAVIQASQLGLEPDTLGRSYLIPYKSECQFVPGWKGLVELVNRSGQGTVWTGAVFTGDEFDWALGDAPFVKHRPLGEYGDDNLTHVYAIGRARGSEWPVIEVWPVERVQKHRDRYNKVGIRHYSFANWEMYARKVVLLQVLKYMPMSPELGTAIAMSDASEVGRQNLSVNDAIEGTWAPVPDNQNMSDGVDDSRVSSVASKVAAAAGTTGGATQSGNGASPAPAKDSQWPHQDVKGIWRDSRGIGFMSEVHGMSSSGIPAVNKSGEFCKRRGCDQRKLSEMEAAALAALSGAASGPEPEPAPSADQEPETAENWFDAAQESNGATATGSGVGYPEIHTAIARAASLEACDEAEDLLRSFNGPDEHLAELQNLLTVRRERLASLIDGQ